MTDSAFSPPLYTIWVVSDGRRGIENQALGLAEAVSEQLDRPVTIHRVIVRKDRYVTLPSSAAPDLWIGCGRAAIPLARKHAQIFPGAYFVYVQDPRGRYDDFDLIIAPDHDRVRKGHTLTMVGSPNRIRQSQLDAASDQFADQIENLSEPRAAILIGGDSKRFKLSTEIADYLIERLEGLVKQDVSLMITVSRRTSADVQKRLAETFKDRPGVWFYNGEGANPYFAFLAAADWIFVTEESTNMLVEAATVGKPVYALPMQGTPGKFGYLHAALEGHGALRPYLGHLERWTYPRLAETERMAQLLIKNWQAASEEAC